MSAEIYPTVSEFFGLLSSTLRRCVLYQLLQREQTTVEELSRWILTVDGPDSVAGGPGDDGERLAVSLVHNHLPRLADLDLVTWDAGTGEVARGDVFEEAAPLLESVRSIEREATVDSPVIEAVIATGAEVQ